MRIRENSSSPLFSSIPCEIEVRNLVPLLDPLEVSREFLPLTSSREISTF